jgi:tetratricopeptide (TPR) repeat protein
MRLIVGDWHRPTGVRVELGGARALKKHGEFAEALLLLKQELEKDPLDREGLLLLAELHDALQQPVEAMKALQKLLNNPGLSADQIGMVSERIRRIEERQLIASLNQR